MKQAEILIPVIKRTSFFRALSRRFDEGALTVGLDRSGAALHSLAAACLYNEKTNIVLVAEDSESAHRLVADLKALLPEEKIFLFPGPEIFDEVVLPLRMFASAARLRVLDALSAEDGRAVLVVTTVEGLCADTLDPVVFRQSRSRLSVSSSVDRDELLESLVIKGYKRVTVVTAPGEVSVRGGIIDVFSPQYRLPARIDLWGDEIDGIRFFDPVTQRSVKDVRAISILVSREFVCDEGVLKQLRSKSLKDERALELMAHLETRGLPEGVESLLAYLPNLRSTLVDYLAPGSFLVWALLPLAMKRAGTLVDGALSPGRFKSVLDTAEKTRLRCLFACGRPGADRDKEDVLVETGYRRIPDFGGDIKNFSRFLEDRLMAGWSVSVALPSEGEIRRLRELLADREDFDVLNKLRIIKLDLHCGFELCGDRCSLVCGPDLWEERTIKKEDIDFPVDEQQRVSFADFAELEKGCLVVHVAHGIGRYAGLDDMLIDGVRQEFIEIEYARGDKLFVPINQLDRVQKFIGLEGGRAPRLNRLGGARWGQVKNRVKRSVEEMAKELLDLYARREQARGWAFSPDTIWQGEMEDAFPFQDTRDQKISSRDVKRDMQKESPMDRLLCGDVGYGKTEVAIRAAFKAVQDGKQVAVLVPTTILAQQHFQTFSARLAAFPVRVAVLSRLKTTSENKKTVAAVARGDIDIVIGTHRLLSKDVRFRDLGLLVVDEEQRFGVGHKEKVKRLKTSVDVLTLSATPIPRTLNLAMSGVRDISVINTPPKGRLPIRTVVEEYDERIVKGALSREIARGGQVYYVCNRIEQQQAVLTQLKSLVPSARVRTGHGRMSRQALESLMIDFYKRDFDVLVSTTIIESGLDIPNVNTIIIEDAHRFGLAQLYQLRGRVGRTTRQAYAYLLYPAGRVLPEIAYKRLKAVEEFSELGSGFKIAMRDLELRGAGNILGKAQHGFVQSIGFELYTRLLRDAVDEIKGGGRRSGRRPCTIELQVDSFIPSDYIVDAELKMLYYRKLAEVVEYRELDELVAEMEDRFGPVPPRLHSLVRLVRLKIRATETGLASIRQKGDNVTALFSESDPPPRAFSEKLFRQAGKGISFHSGTGRGFSLELGGARNQAILDKLEQLLEFTS